MRLERALTGAASGLAIVAILLIGGVHRWTQVGLSAAALILSALFVVGRDKREVRVLPFFAPALLATAYTALQLVPMPSAVVRWLSPVAVELRTDALGATPGWMPITLDVPVTLLELAKGLACFSLLVIVATLVRSRQRAHRVLIPLALAGGAVALLTFVQRVTGAQSVLGLYTPRSLLGSGFFGTLMNSNHAASVFTLGALLSLGLALELDGAWRFALGCSAGLSGVALLLTQSRGGALGIAVGGVIFAAVYATRKLGRVRGLVLVLLLTVTGAGGSLWLAEGLRSRLMPEHASQLWSNPKTRGWRDGLLLTSHFPLTGVGRGAFEGPLQAYRAHDEGVRLIYPENFVVQMASEWGVPVALALLLLLGMAATRIARRLAQLDAGTLAAACAVLAVVIHDLADFGLEMPGVALPTVVALGVVIGRVEGLSGKRAGSSGGPAADDRGGRRFRSLAALPALAGWLLLLGGAAWAAEHTPEADSARVEAATKSGNPARDPAELQRVIARHPAYAHLQLLAAIDAFPRDVGEAMKHLDHALWLHPADWQGHRLAARALASTGHRSQAALEYRLATERGMTPTLDELLKVTGSYVVDAVPQNPESLLGLARFLAIRHKPALSDLAVQRAVEQSDHAAEILLERVKLAAQGKDPRIVLSATNAALEDNADEQVYVESARALEAVGDHARADEVLQRGMHRFPDVATLALDGARMHLQRGDAAGARSLLARPLGSKATLAERRDAEELRAKIAEREGDLESAVLARARARLLAHQLDQNESQAN